MSLNRVAGPLLSSNAPPVGKVGFVLRILTMISHNELSIDVKVLGFMPLFPELVVTVLKGWSDLTTAPVIHSLR